MPAAKEGQKLCMVCGQDVSGKPRVKDAQGRYVCAGECQQKLLATAAKPAAKTAPAIKPPPLPAEDDVMGRLINASPMMNALNCGECGAPMAAGSVVCVRCGHNTQTGKSLKTAVVKVKEEKAPKAVRGKYTNKYATSNGPPFWKFLLIYSAALSCVSLLVFAGPAGVWIAIAVLILASIVAWIACVIAAFRNDQTLFGILGLVQLVPFVGIVGTIGMLIFNLFFNEDDASRALYWGTWIAGAVFGAVLFLAITMGFNVDLGSMTLSPRG